MQPDTVNQDNRVSDTQTCTLATLSRLRNFTSEVQIVIGSLFVFALDLYVPLGVAMGSLYVIPIVLVISAADRALVLRIAWLTSLLTLLAFSISWTPETIWKVYVNRLISIASIWAVTWVILKYLEMDALRIGQLLEQKRSVERRNQELNSKNRELEQFAYIASHDLQEPLRTISSFTELLAKDLSGGASVKQAQFIDFIQESALRMRELIHALLEYSRIGRDLSKTIIDPRTVVDAAVADLGALIADSGANIDIQPLPGKVYADSRELRMLFQNLINNAIKFRLPSVQPKVVVRGREIKGGWEFSVEDNGIGISEDHKDKIFIIFQRLHNRQTYGGTGIGLANCLKIVELHGGEIDVNSQVGVGSTFVFTIKEPEND